MIVRCVSEKVFSIDSAATVLAPLDKKEREQFDSSVDEWESDRAWVFCHPGDLIVHDGKVERVLSVS